MVDYSHDGCTAWLIGHKFLATPGSIVVVTTNVSIRSRLDQELVGLRAEPCACPNASTRPVLDCGLLRICDKLGVSAEHAMEP